MSLCTSGGPRAGHSEAFGLDSFGVRSHGIHYAATLQCFIENTSLLPSNQASWPGGAVSDLNHSYGCILCRLSAIQLTYFNNCYLDYEIRVVKQIQQLG